MIDIYLDCANLSQIKEARKNPLVKGFTTNPTLLHSAGVTDYEKFAREALEAVEGLPISFEVFSDEWDDMERQARKIASWGSNVNVKIPITNTKGESAALLVRKLSDSGIICNVTAVMTQEQIERFIDMNIIISVFAGRIADTGVDPSFLDGAGRQVNGKPKFLWASSREVLNIYQAEQLSYDIITVTPDLLAKYEKYKNMDLTEFSLQTVHMFYQDAKKAGFKL